MHIKFNLQFPVPTAKLPKITESELAEKLDETVNAVREHDTGVVITQGDKPNLILCPAAWFNYCFDDDFGCVINSAVRYAIGRNTYMPLTVANYVRSFIDVLDNKTVNVMIEDIDRALKDEYLDQAAVWSNLRRDLIAHLKTEP